MGGRQPGDVHLAGGPYPPARLQLSRSLSGAREGRGRQGEVAGWYVLGAGWLTPSERELTDAEPGRVRRPCGADQWLESLHCFMLGERARADVAVHVRAWSVGGLSQARVSRTGCGQSGPSAWSARTLALSAGLPGHCVSGHASESVAWVEVDVHVEDGRP